jgi:uncharacterized protein (DUF305 family)
MYTGFFRRLLPGILLGALVVTAAGTTLAQAPTDVRGDWTVGGRPAAGDIGPARGLMQGPGPHGATGMAPGHPMGAMQSAARHYIEAMIPHHEDAIVMAKLARAQAEHPELRALAEEIIRVQAEEIGLMREWYLAWYGTEVAGSRMHGMMVGMGPNHDATAIDGARPFDKAFVEAMIPHHEMAVRMSAMALSRVERPELRALLQAIIVGQSDEIALMRRWYEAWYGANSPRPLRPAGAQTTE